MEKIRELKKKLPNLKAVVQILPPYAQYVKRSDGFWRWSEIEDLDTDLYDEEYQQRLKEIKANEVASIVFTSGTTGQPKGAMLSHDNFTFICRSVKNYLNEFEEAQEHLVSYLPLSHVAAQCLDIFVIMSLAGTVYFADRDALKGSLLKTLTEARPTVFLGVPRVFEKIQEKMIEASSQNGALKRTLGTWAKNVTLKHHLDCISGINTTSMQYKLAKMLVMTKVRAALGFDRNKFLVTGAGEQKFSFFKSFDIKSSFLQLQ